MLTGENLQQQHDVKNCKHILNQSTHNRHEMNVAGVKCPDITTLNLSFGHILGLKYFGYFGTLGLEWSHSWSWFCSIDWVVVVDQGLKVSIQKKKEAKTDQT